MPITILAMAQRKTWKAQVTEFIRSRTSPFTLDELQAQMTSKRSRRSLTLYLEDSGLTVSPDSQQYIPIGWFLREARILVKPQAWEIADGVLAPGHRLLPLHYVAVPPSKLTFMPAATDSTPFPRKTVAVPLSRAMTYFSLFGWEMIPIVLGTEDRANMDIDLSDSQDAVVRLSVLEIGELYRTSGFNEGDYLECRLVDWWDGVFTVSVRKAAELTDDARNGWNDTLKDAFDLVFRRFGAPGDIPTQLSHAWYFGATDAGSSFLKNPAGTVGELLAAKNDLRIISVPLVPSGLEGGLVGSSIWNDNLAPGTPDDFDDFDDSDDFDETYYDLDEILSDIGAALSESEVEGYMRDALFHRQDFNDVIRRIFPRSFVLFADERQEEEFYDELDRLWVDVCDVYDPADDTDIGPLRSRLLKLYDRQLKWIRNLDARGVDPSDLPEEALFHMGKFFGMISGAIELLNTDLGHEGQELQLLAEKLPELERITEELLAQADPAPVYELKISLKGIRPPIWRRIRVPGGVTLDRLHRIFQVAMGWDNSHLHAFMIRGVDYISADLYDVDGEPEEEYTLHQLGLATNSHFTYTYDFGDDWRHEVVVSKILDPKDLPESDRTTPRLITGKRAAPPGRLRRPIRLLPVGRNPQRPDRERHYRLYQHHRLPRRRTV